MTTQVKMTPLLRRLVATRYFTYLVERGVISRVTQIKWESLSEFFRLEKPQNTTDAVKLIWDLVDSIPLTTEDNIDTVKPRKGRL